MKRKVVFFFLGALVLGGLFWVSFFQRTRQVQNSAFQELERAMVKDNELRPGTYRDSFGGETIVQEDGSLDLFGAARTKPPDEYRIALVGGWPLIGLGLRPWETIPGQLQQMFDAMPQPSGNEIQKFRIFNFGIPKMALPEHLERIFRKHETLAIDLIIVMLSGDLLNLGNASETPGCETQLPAGLEGPDWDRALKSLETLRGREAVRRKIDTLVVVYPPNTSEVDPVIPLHVEDRLRKLARVAGYLPLVFELIDLELTPPTKNACIQPSARLNSVLAGTIKNHLFDRGIR